MDVNALYFCTPFCSHGDFCRFCTTNAIVFQQTMSPLCRCTAKVQKSTQIQFLLKDKQTAEYLQTSKQTADLFLKQCIDGI